MERLKTKKPKFRQLKRIGTMALAATIALSVPAVSNVVGKVSPINNIEVSAAEQTNLMNSNEILTNVHNSYNDSEEHWTHNFGNSGDMSIDGPEVDLTDLTYVVKLPDELSHLLDDEYVLDYLFGKVTNFDSAQSPFTFTGHAIDENGEQITIAKDTHKPFEHISINKGTNSIEFDFTSFYEANNLKPEVRQNVNGEYFFDTLGFTTPIIVPDERILDNGTYELKSAYVRGTSVDLDNVSNAYSVDLVVDYSTDPEPEPEPDPEVNKSDLAAVLEEAEDYEVEDYTEESYLVFTAAAEAALVVFENEEATQDEVDKAVADLEAAIAGLVEEPVVVNTEALEALVEEANGIDADGFTTDSFAAFTAALEAAEDVLANEEATQEEVDEALADLEAAIDGLEEVEEPKPEPEPEVNTEALEALVEEANGIDADGFTTDSFAAFTAALEAAEDVLVNEEATQENVDEAVANLEAAIDGLVEVEEPKPEPEPEVNTEALEALVEEANGIEADGFTNDSFAVFTTALEAAEAVLANEEATQENVDEAVANLEAAIDGLEEVEEPKPEPKPEPEPEVDTSGLETTLANAEGYDAADYTNASFVALTEALEAAETVLANEEATQEEIDKAVANLESAIDGLSKVEAEKPEEEEEVSIIDDEPEEGKGNTLPKTATSSFNMILGGFLALLVGAGSLFLGRRKLN